MSNSIATLYELNQSLADLGSKPDFEELRLGPLLKQPVVYDMFKAPQGLPTVPHLTTIQILKHLEKYMTKEDLWRTKVDLKKFMEYLCEEYRCDTPYELGVRIQSIGLAISVLLFHSFFSCIPVFFSRLLGRHVGLMVRSLDLAWASAVKSLQVSTPRS